MPLTSAPTAVTIPVRQGAAAIAEAGKTGPERISASSLTGWTTRCSSSGSMETSTCCGSTPILTRYSEPPGLDDPLEKLSRARLSRVAEDLIGRALLQDH